MRRAFISVNTISFSRRWENNDDNNIAYYAGHQAYCIYIPYIHFYAKSPLFQKKTSLSFATQIACFVTIRPVFPSFWHKDTCFFYKTKQRR